MSTSINESTNCWSNYWSDQSDNDLLLHSMDILSQQNNKSRRRKRSRAGKRRFRKLVETNVSTAEGQQCCRKPWSELKAVKRILSDDDLPTLESKKSLKLSETVVKPNQATVTGSPRVGIRNVIPMNVDQMNQIHQAFKEEILKIHMKGAGPRFLGFSHRAGWILITCMDEASRQWIFRTIPKLRLWPYAQLSIMAESELPKPVTGATFFPESEAATLEEALEMIRLQNPKLNPEQWRLLHSKKEKSGLFVLFSLDDPSVQALQNSNNKIILGFKSIILKVNGSESSQDTESLLAPLLHTKYYKMPIRSDVKCHTNIGNTEVHNERNLAYLTSSSLGCEEELVLQVPGYFAPNPLWTRRT